MVWALTQDRVFSVISAYSLVAQASNCSWVASQVWLKGCPLKISFFMLRLLLLWLPLTDVLYKFGAQGPSRCHCYAEPGKEGLNHTFCIGDVAKAVWSSFEDPGEVGGCPLCGTGCYDGGCARGKMWTSNAFIGGSLCSPAGSWGKQGIGESLKGEEWWVLR